MSGRAFWGPERCRSGDCTSATQLAIGAKPAASCHWSSNEGAATLRRAGDAAGRWYRVTHLTARHCERQIHAFFWPCSMNAPVMVELDGESDPLEIAVKELRAKKIPFTVRRYLPDGRCDMRCWCQALSVYWKTRPDLAAASELRGCGTQAFWAARSLSCKPCALQLRGLEGVGAGGDGSVAPGASADPLARCGLRCPG